MAVAVPARQLDSAVDLAAAMDVAWMLFGGCLVFFMHTGFTLLEAGSVRRKSGNSILVKNLLTVCSSAVAWMFLGWGVAFGRDNHGGNGFIGVDGYLAQSKELSKTGAFKDWFFQWTFCATAATIVSGAVAERCGIMAYGLASMVITTFIYPVVVHWTWGGGYLAGQGYKDFAGSGIVHLTGGTAALILAKILGPRNARFDPDAQTLFRPSNHVNIAVGAMILWFGWYGFNAGSTLQLSGGNAQLAAHICCTTTLSAAGGGLSAFAISILLKENPAIALPNGILAGLVGVTAGCANVDLYAALIIGLIAGATYSLANWGLFKAQIDDPVSASAVHGACGIWGVLAMGLFHTEDGLLYGAPASKLLWPNLQGIVLIMLWTSVWATVGGLALDKAGIFRVPLDAERMGMDVYEFGQMCVDEAIKKMGGMSPVSSAMTPNKGLATSMKNLDGQVTVTPHEGGKSLELSKVL